MELTLADFANCLVDMGSPEHPDWRPFASVGLFAIKAKMMVDGEVLFMHRSANSIDTALECELTAHEDTALD